MWGSDTEKIKILNLMWMRYLRNECGVNGFTSKVMWLFGNINGKLYSRENDVMRRQYDNAENGVSYN